MAEGIAIIFITLLTYTGLLLFQKRRNGVPWNRLFKKGDPWFFLNLPIALVCGLAFGPHLVDLLR
jgi:hypothetical protein